MKPDQHYGYIGELDPIEQLVMRLLIREHLQEELKFKSEHYHITFHSDSPFSLPSASARLSRVTTVLMELSKSSARTWFLVEDACDPLTNTLIRVGLEII